MVKGEEETSDGLEIISIGTLYDGSWDKKYWSSSRGKDRYPYPVGYQAVRTHNGITYKMGILEGLKGPLFTINSTNGQACSGQTPDIVWENFQKKGCARLKMWHGKRFSGKIDGVEFFGFKNPFVQRLLRELVSNIGGTAEPSLLSSNSYNGAHETKHLTPCEESCTELSTNSDLLPHLAKPQVTGKSRKHKIVKAKLTIEDSPKRLRSRDLKCNDDASISRQRSKRKHNSTNNSLPSSESNQEYGICNNLGVVLQPVNSETLLQEKSNSISVEDGSRFSSFDSSEPLRDEGLLSQEETKLIGSKNFIAPENTCNSFEDKEPLDRSKLTEAQGFTSSKPVEKMSETPVLNDPQTINSIDLYAPDTLDPQLDSSNFTLDSPKKNTYKLKDELIAANKVICEDLVTESRSEEEMVTSTANGHSEKSDFDSIDQDIAKSMMTVLLPRALPLIKTFSRKKRTTKTQSDIPLCSIRTHEKNNETDFTPDVATPAGVLTENLNVERQKEKMHILCTDLDSAVLSCGDITSIAPDSFEDDQCENLMSNKLLTFPNVAEADRSNFVQNTCTPLSESIVCRNFGDVCAPETDTATKTLLTLDNCRVISCQSLVISNSSGDKVRLDLKHNDFHMDKDSIISESAVCNMVPATLQNQDFVRSSNYNDNSTIVDSSISCKEKSQVYGEKELFRHQDLVEFDGSVSSLLDQGQNICDNMTENEEVKNGSNSSTQSNIKRNSALEGVLELVGCYVHPMPISLVLLSTKGNDVYICVLCGPYMDKDRTLFIYKAAITGKGSGDPSFIGHTYVMVPAARDSFGREIAMDSSGLQFTPDGQCLVLLNSIKAPYCREGNINCSCTACSSDCFEKNAVKIVQVRDGYVSVMGRLEVTGCVQCILVCEPSYLVAAEESGRLHLWVMNSSWSSQTEECYLQTSDCAPSHVVELKKIPKCAFLIVGHNGFGEFSVWDISKRILVSRYSAPTVSVFQFIPVSLFRWQNMGCIHTGPDIEYHINKIMDEAKMCFSGSENHDFLSTEGEDVAILLLVSAVSDPDVQHDYESNGCQGNSTGWWRLALLVKNVVILGIPLDPRATTIGVSAGHGIIATSDGHVYMWELSTGSKLGNLQFFKGTGVSYIATDYSSSGALAVAGGCQLQVYLHSPKSFADQGTK